MKFAILLLFVAVVAVQGAKVHYSALEVDSMFEQFKITYSKQYPTPSEESLRKSIFASALEFIAAHNLDSDRGLHSYRVGINKFADLTNEEFRVTYLYRIRTPGRSSDNLVHQNVSIKDLPVSVDWVAKGAVTPPINQGQCGSSWAIPAAAAIEGQHAIRRKTALLALSIQQLLDCCTPDGNQGCNGGLFDDAYKCVIRMGGIDTAASYPYTGNGNQKCMFNTKTIGETIRNYADISPNEASLQYSVANIGPISVAVDASQYSFQMYSSGVYDDPACSSVYPDHGVTVVGYGVQNGDKYDEPYWQVKNSWGTDWGMGGYILMSRNKNNQCGIADYPSYPIL